MQKCCREARLFRVICDLYCIPVFHFSPKRTKKVIKRCGDSVKENTVMWYQKKACNRAVFCLLSAMLWEFR